MARWLLPLTLLLSWGCSDDPLIPDAGQDLASDVLVVDVRKDIPLKDYLTQEGMPPDSWPDQTPINDGPTIQDLSGDAAAFPLCSAKGGYCTKQRWVICGVGYEPIQPTPHQDCGVGWCCVKAPASTCSAKAGVNCIWGSKCSGCWGAARDTTLTCEAGRVCCMDICD